jgi:hypothetical protein
MHDGLDDHRVFQDQHGAHEVVAPARHFQPSSEVGFIAVPRLSGVDQSEEQIFPNVPLGHAFPGVSGDDHGAVEPSAVHGWILSLDERT